MALVITLSETKDPYMTITHEGEQCKISIQEIRCSRPGSSRVVLAIDAPQSFAVLRSRAKKRTP